MMIDPSVWQILEKAAENGPPTKQECCQLLSFPEQSLESGVLMAAADFISRRRFANKAMLLGQIGIEIAPCPGRCKFCAFSANNPMPDNGQLSNEQILERARAFSEVGDLYALFLMTMHDFDFSHLLSVVSAVRQVIPLQTQIVVNIGDLEGNQADELRSAGVRGAYHICRLREGTDTDLHTEQRIRTIELVRQAGLDLYYCCEPIGPEHTPEELADQIFVGIEFGCFQHAAMRRVGVLGTPLFEKGQITERRLAQITAVVALATLGCKETKSIAVHEPNLLGLCAGANTIYAETGANPRDTVSDTKGHRGLDMNDCRKMLREAGFDGLIYGETNASARSMIFWANRSSLM
jgi:biotin synthase